MPYLLHYSKYYTETSENVFKHICSLSENKNFEISSTDKKVEFGPFFQLMIT